MGAVLLFPSSGITYKYRATKRGFASALLAEPARLVAASWRVLPTSVHTWPNKSGVLKSTRAAGRRACRGVTEGRGGPVRAAPRPDLLTAWRCGRRATTGGGCVCAAWCGRRATGCGGCFVCACCLPLGCLALDFFLAILIRVRVTVVARR